MENRPFIDDFPIKTTFHRGFSMAMLNKQMVSWNIQATEFSDTCGEAKAPQNPAEQEVDSEAEAAGRISCRTKTKL